MPDLSIIIPTYARASKISACIGRLSQQDVAPASRFEVLVGLDGPDDEASRAVRRAWPDPPGDALAVIECPRAGYNAVRNELLTRARGTYILSLNDDVLPDPGLVRAHLDAHAEAEARRAPAIVTGYSPWLRHEPDRLFDRLVRETSMVFFQDAMNDDDPWRDWGYRHAWGLNCSFPAAFVREVGGWTAFPLAYGYDDIEIAWRIRERFDAPVLYRPSALAPHDHRMEPGAYLERERRLGESAWRFAQANPAFGLDLFGRDITSDDEIAYSRQFVERERAGVERARETFLHLADIPADAVDGEHARTLIQMLYQQHLPLKRWEWRTGILAAAQADQPTPAGARS